MALADMARRSGLGAATGALADRSVLLRVADPLFAAVALIELDGVARRIVLAPPDLPASALPGVIAAAEVDAVVCDAPEPVAGGLLHALVSHPHRPLEDEPRGVVDSEWVMFTSGTSGPPKMVIHRLAALTGAIRPAAPDEPPPVWGTFYDIRRYGGLQILLRALLGEGSLAITSPAEPMADFIRRLADHRASHITGTPSHWRRLLMTPEATALEPRYLRLSGEIADQAVLDALKARFPGVPVGHAYASTEAGVGFEVNDGLEGFPAEYVGRAGPVALKVADGSLRVRSPRASAGYLGGGPLCDDEGYIDTGDMVERRGDRYHFVGRRGGVINVGGLKVHPEEIEAVINGHPGVRASRVSARRSPITGAIVVAEVVLAASADEAAARGEILALCRARLPAHKTPAMLKIAPALAMTAGGKLERAIA